MKTLKEWNKIGGTFTDYAKPGDEINVALYDYFLGVVYPIRLSKNAFLSGECVYHKDGEGFYDCFNRTNSHCYYTGQITIAEFDKKFL